MLDGSDEYRQLLRDYHTIHAKVWGHLGEPECRTLLDSLADMASRLDALNPDWWKQPKPA